MLKKNNWRFDKEIAEIFDTHVHQSIPFYDVMQKSIIDMSIYFAQNNTKIIDIGTSTGALIKKMNNKFNDINKTLTFIGIDSEVDMIEKCNKTSKEYDINFEVGDAVTYDYSNSSIITSMLTLQFIEKKYRPILLKNIYDGLNIDGAFFMVEKVKNNIIDIHDIYNDLYYDFKRESEICDKEILDKNGSIRGIMKPATLEENIKMLDDVGFKKIDIFFKYNNFVGICAIK